LRNKNEQQCDLTSSNDCGELNDSSEEGCRQLRLLAESSWENGAQRN